MAKEKNVTLVNSGVCSIFIKGDRYVPVMKLKSLSRIWKLPALKC
ncbi:hypothetical protein [Enterobacter phage N5822]|nr:hypothetical protein [Enterobacter phage N5822]